MNLIWPTKNPDATLNYEVDWGPFLGSDTIVTSVWSVTYGDVVLGAEDQTDTTTTVIISGGTPGVVAQLLNVITMASGLIDSAYIQLPIYNTDPLAAPSTTTKGLLVSMALEEIGLAPYQFDTSPEETASALRRLDALMIEWEQQGMDLGYNYPAYMGGSTVNDPSGIEDLAVNASIQQLALRIAPAIGKTISAESKKAYAQSLAALRTHYAVIPERILARGTAIGAGNKPWSTWNPYGWRTD